MDPYVKLIIGGEQVYKTEVKDDMGKNPVWNEECTYEVKDRTLEIKLIVSDEEVFRDEVIGERTMQLSQLLRLDNDSCTGSVESNYTISYENQSAGTIRMATTFTDFKRAKEVLIEAEQKRLKQEEEEERARAEAEEKARKEAEAAEKAEKERVRLEKER